ncbi:lytic transglycosylase domain-containing protein [Nocardioides anomalus]|uniref:Lytic transglycosylase domain-containing protein n=1 Tax=Nocardioides anomalus TaxID=2712223 RepID=A0A6G6WGM7_9ACTN|nr:lytic transglycosylase domain-containing protein [Nocardioides anomalus]QIG44313.1 lytic transglycosylase domain-containing protein [Nocardioides anomalus]
MAVAGTVIAVGSGALSLGADGGTDGPASSAQVADALAPVTPVTAAADAKAETASEPSDDTATSDPDAADASAAKVLADRTQVVTRSDSRAAADPLKKDALSLGAGNTMARTEDLSDEDPRDIARALLASYGWDESQFGCLDSLWTRESGWNVYADNPSSSAYGIPQALPGSKMSSEGDDWATNPVTQIRWGLGYIQDRYGSPCGAWGHSQAQGFY